MAEPAIFFGPSPNLNDLCYINVELSYFESANTGPKRLSSTTQPHIVKCREIIFTEPDIIASPAFGFDNTFNVILKQLFFKTGRLQARLQKQGMTFSKPCRVSLSLYQECLRYTVTARLAPAWNRVGDWFIQGRDFLAHEGYSNAVKMELFVNKDEVFISLFGTAVRFPPLTIKDLDLTPAEYQALVRSTEDDVKDIVISDRWCHVLPSMKKGKISSLSITIPRSGPFSTYQDLKRYWKNVYGYRLPDNDDEILYCQIGFLPSGTGKSFTYPNICLRSSPVQVISRTDPKPILSSFLQDVHSKLPSVCGVTFRFQPKMFFVSSTLHNAAQFSDHASLSGKPRVASVVRPINTVYFNKPPHNAAPENQDGSDHKVSGTKGNADDLEKMSQPLPYFNTQPTPSSHELTSQCSVTKLLPIFRPKKKALLVNVHQTNSVAPKDNHINSHNNHVLPRESTNESKLHESHDLVMKSNLFSSVKHPAQPSISRVNNNTENIIPQPLSCMVTPKTNQPSSHVKLSQVKKSQQPSGDTDKQQSTEGESKSKKPRKKAEIKNLDVDSLARAGQLNKVNTITLIAWLKDRGTICKAKDKKPDLIKKVNTVLNIASFEE